MQDKQPLVSVVIPTHNRPEMLIRALRSVSRQTYSNLEIIVIDDNSACSYASVLADFPSVIYHRNERNMGGSLARNVGLRMAMGEFIAFLDDDDEFERNKIAQQVYVFASSDLDNLGVVYCNYKVVDGTGAFIQYGRVGPRGDVLVEHLKRNITPTSAALIKKEAIESVGGFRDLICAQEYDLWMRLADAGFRFDYCGDVLLLMHAHCGPRISNSDIRIKGLRYIYAEKLRYFNRLKPHDAAYVTYDHHLTIFREYVFMNDRRNARSEYWKAVKVIFFRPENLIELPALFIDYTYIMKLKGLLHRLKKSISAIKKR